MMPGRTLHRLAARICSAQTLERVVEPAIADVQKEYAAAEFNSAFWRTRVLLVGYLAILEVMLMCALQPAVAMDDERCALVRTFILAGGITVCACAFVVLLTVSVFPGVPPFFLALMTAMMLPIALPVGLTLGMAFGSAAERFHHGPQSRFSWRPSQPSPCLSARWCGASPSRVRGSANRSRTRWAQAKWS
jgi:hypothetical protein